MELNNLILVIIGPILAGLIVFKPGWFWSILISTLIISFGVMFQGYALLDEYYAGWMVVGAVIAWGMGRVKWKGGRACSFHEILFILLVSYLIIESIRGLVTLQDWRLLRYVIYFSLIGLISLTLGRLDFPIPTFKQILLVITGSGFAYLALYLAHGVYFEQTLGIGRLGKFAMQGNYWSGSAYAMFFLSVSTPAAVLLYGDRSRNLRAIGLAFLVTAIIVASYFDSRIGLSCLIFFLAVAAIIQVSLKKIATSGIFLVMIICAYFLWAIPIDIVLARIIIFTDTLKTSLSSHGGGINVFNDHWRPSNFIANLIAISSGLLEAVNSFKDSMLFIVDPRGSDVDRSQQLLASLSHLWQHLSQGDIIRFFFGDGMYQHRQTLIPDLVKLGAPISTSGLVRPTGIALFLTDMGLIGFILLAGNFIATAYAIHVMARGASVGKTVLWYMTLLFAFIWIFISNIFDICLFFFIIMPSGLLIQLVRRAAEKAEVPQGQSSSIRHEIKA